MLARFPCRYALLVISLNHTVSTYSGFARRMPNPPRVYSAESHLTLSRPISRNRHLNLIDAPTSLFTLIVEVMSLYDDANPNSFSRTRNNGSAPRRKIYRHQKTSRWIPADLEATASELVHRSSGQARETSTQADVNRNRSLQWVAHGRYNVRQPGCQGRTSPVPPKSRHCRLDGGSTAHGSERETTLLDTGQSRLRYSWRWRRFHPSRRDARLRCRSAWHPVTEPVYIYAGQQRKTTAR